MIDPSNITRYDLSPAELEEVLLFWVCAAGKNATIAARGLYRFLSQWHHKVHSPFEIIRWIDARKGVDLAQELRDCGIGCYSAKARTFSSLASSGLDLQICSVDDLEMIPGIGPKTARCFLIHSRPNQQYAGLDTHVLSYLRDLGLDVPKVTPTGRRYKEVEQKFLRLAKQAEMSVADFDLLVWKAYSGKEISEEAMVLLRSMKIDASR